MVSADERSLIESLQTALQRYSNNLTQTMGLPDVSCTENLEQSSTAAERLSHYQLCADPVVLCPDDGTRCQIDRLQNDLLGHLRESYQEVVCPASSCSLQPDFSRSSAALRCLQCWKQQVEALSLNTL